MSSSSQEQLLGYLLDAIEPNEQEAVAEALAADARLASQLDTLRQGMSVFEDTPYEPPLGLAERTCKFVFQRADALPVALTPVDVGQRSTSSWTDAESPASGRRWTKLDLAMAAAVMVAASVLLFPAMYQSQVNARWTACQNNLRQVGTSLISYSNAHAGQFPTVPESGKYAAAGIYGPTLLSQGYLEDPGTLVCPSSELGESKSFKVPTLEEIDKADPATLAKMRQMMGGSYGYALGYREDGKYKPLRNLNRRSFALMADRPDATFNASANHENNSENVLFEGGRVGKVVGPREEGSDDHIFTNDAGKPAAGLHRNDSVIAPSEQAP